MSTETVTTPESKPEAPKFATAILAPGFEVSTDPQAFDRDFRSTARAAEKITARLAYLIEVGKDGNVHTALGFPSWETYLADVCEKEMPRMAGKDRENLVAVLHAEGLSLRTIARAAGITASTAKRDIDKIKADDKAKMANAVAGIEAPAPTAAASTRAGKTQKTKRTSVQVAHDAVESMLEKIDDIIARQAKETVPSGVEELTEFAVYLASAREKVLVNLENHAKALEQAISDHPAKGNGQTEGNNPVTGTTGNHAEHDTAA